MIFTSKTPILKGWSRDKKFCVTDESGTKYLLRESDVAEYDAKLFEFQMMQQVAALGVPMCLPLEFCANTECVFSVQSWIEGEDLETVLPTLPEEKQRELGLEAGRILRKIHSIPAPEDQTPWSERFGRKIDRYVENYANCELKYENGRCMVDYVLANRHLIEDRPQTYQHGDYHAGNMMLDTDGRLQIIDFNRHDYGDPWEEFNRITWCAQCAPRFAAELVNGYFDGEVPEAFWRLLALYICNNMLGSLPWAIPFGEGEIETMKNQAQDVLNWYDNMTKIVPNWYKKS